MLQTTLHDSHVALSAKMVEFAGWHMPVQYGPILEEVRTVRSKAGLFDLGHMGRLSVTGEDRVAFLDRILTNHVARIPVGSIRYSLVCREDGGPIDDLLVYRGDDEVYLVVNASNRDAVLAWMQEQRGDSKVEIADLTDEQAMIALQGPASVELLRPFVSGMDPGDIGYYKFGFGTVCGADQVRISRTGYTGEDGYEVYLPAQLAPELWDSLCAAGKDIGATPIGLGARDTLRLEAGMPLYGHELDFEHNPIEAGLSFAISFREEKGDWIGRAALAAIKAAPTRKLVGLTTKGPRVPRQGYPVYRGEELLGAVCSGSPSPTLETNIATAYVPVERGEIGETLELDIRGKRQAVTVHELPFYSRKR